MENARDERGIGKRVAAKEEETKEAECSEAKETKRSEAEEVKCSEAEENEQEIKTKKAGCFEVSE